MAIMITVLNDNNNNNTVNYNEYRRLTLIRWGGGDKKSDPNVCILKNLENGYTMTNAYFYEYETFEAL